MSKNTIYIGKKKVEQFMLSKEANLVGVKFEEGTTDEYSIRQWESMKSDKVYDDSLVPVRKWAPLIKELLNGMLEDGMKLGEKDFILERIDTSITKNFEEAINQLLKANHSSQINLKQVDAVLRHNGRVEYEEVKPVKTEESKEDNKE